MWFVRSFWKNPLQIQMASSDSTTIIDMQEKEQEKNNLLIKFELNSVAIF